MFFGHRMAVVNTWAPLLEKLVSVQAGEEDKLVCKMLSESGPRSLAFVNAHAFNISLSDQRIASAFLDADFLVRDGIGTKILCVSAAIPPGKNMNGTDFIPRLLSTASGTRVVLIRSDDETVNKAAALLASAHKIVLQENGFQSFEYYLERLRDANPDFIVLGMGMPRQELFAAYVKRHLAGSYVIICGGAILGFISGHIPRAPKLLQNSGFEWLYRLALEPRRLARRYIIGNPWFLWNVLFNLMYLRRSLEQRAEAKTSRMSVGARIEM